MADSIDAEVQDGGSESGGVDWAVLLQRLRDAQSGGTQGTLTADERRGVLRQRARDLARVDDGDGEELEYTPVVEFTLGSERFAVLATTVREICPVRAVTPVPGVPGHVSGVLAVRGRIVAVVDLQVLIGAPEPVAAGETRGIILQHEAMEFAVLADEIIGLRLMALAKLQTGVSALTGPREAYLLGVTQDRIAVLDAESMLRDSSLVASQQRVGGDTA